MTGDELRIYREGAEPFVVPMAAVVSAATYPAERGERYVRVEAVREPSPLVFSLRAPDAASLADEINRAARATVT